MPRFEYDSRMGRVRSMATANDIQDGTFAKAPRKYVCTTCGHPALERSLHCPNKNCEKKTMGEIVLIPEKLREEANRKAIERAKRRARGTL